MLSLATQSGFDAVMENAISHVISLFLVNTLLHCLSVSQG